MITIIVVLLALLSPPPPFSATWDAPGRATLRWSQTDRSCLYRESALRERVFLGCFDGSGPATVRLGGPQTDAAFRPQAHDTFILDSAGEVRRADLRGVVYLAIFRG